jgi:tetratricopeptide (TPR) repeat protein
MLVAALALSLAASAAPPPWLGPAFTADPADLARAAAALQAPRDVEVDILLEEVTLSFDEAGRQTWVERMVFIPRTRGAVETWGTLAADYNPRFQGRPEIRGRVISPAGKATSIDAASIVDGVLDRSEGRQYGDRRVVHAVLPGLEPGAVVEEEVVIGETAPFFEAGSASRLHENRSVPVRAVRIQVDAPSSLKLRVSSHELPAPKEATAGGRRAFTLAVDDLAGLPAQEASLPPELRRSRHLDVSTGASWAEIAKGYAAVVRKQLEGSDLAATARELVKAGDSPAEAAQKVLDWIGARVRYTGLTLQQNGLVPATPTETVQRRFGDCKDLSTLAVGLLRAAGLRADVAVLRTSDDQPDPGHPGMGQFDHAVVRVEARPAVWLDPASGTPAGTLAPGSQGRLALVAAPGTTGLVRTPESSADASRISRLRRLELPEYGWAKAVEENRYGGLIGALITGGLRTETAEQGEKAARRRLRAPEAAVVTRRFEAGTGKAPSLWRAEADLSQLGFTGSDDGYALVSPIPLFAYLPAPFRTAPLESGEVDAPPPPRKEPLQIRVPYETELRYEITPPPGFKAGPLPSVEGFTVGPARFEAHFNVQPEGGVLVRYSFVAGRDLKPTEADQLWRRVADLTASDGPRVSFERVSAALLREGKPREALDEIRRLTRLHPAEARHHNHLALLLLDLHMGEAARAEAREAAALEPRSEWAQRILAQTLQRDLLARPFAAGSDIPGAEAALRKAVELSSGASNARGALAELLLVDVRGERVGPGPRLDEALELLGQVRAQGVHSYDETWLEALFAAGRTAEALEEAKRAPATRKRNAVLVAAGLLQGQDAFADALARIETPAREAAVKGGLFLLVACRRFEGFGTLVTISRARGSASPDQIALMERVARIRPATLGPLDPRDPALLPARLFVAIATPDPAAAKGAMAALVRSGVPLTGADADVLRSFNVGAMLGDAGAGVGLKVLADLVLSLAKVEVEGDGPWRIDSTLSPGPGAQKGSTTLRIIAVKENKLPKIALVDPTPAQVARLALELGKAGDLQAARRLVGWARQGLSAAPPGSPSVSGVGAALWPEGGTPTDAELLRFAAGVGAFAPDEPPHVELGVARLREGTAGAVRTALVLAELAAAGEDQARALSLTDELATAGPEVEAALTPRRAAALYDTGRKVEARRLLEERAAAHPDDLRLLRMLIGFEYEDGDVKAARAHEAKLLAHAKADPGDANDAAWRRLFFPPLDSKALEQARAAKEKTRGPGASVLHTIASLEAFLERPPADTMASLLKTVNARQGRVVGEDWLVVGRVAETYGLLEAAAAAYRRVPAPRQPQFDSTYELARRRLAALEASSPEGKARNARE